jgi:hypothetical protein
VMRTGNIKAYKFVLCASIKCIAALF